MKILISLQRDPDMTSQFNVGGGPAGDRLHNKGLLIEFTILGEFNDTNKPNEKNFWVIDKDLRPFVEYISNSQRNSKFTKRYRH